MLRLNSVSYGYTEPLNERPLNLTLNKGEVVVITGDNGKGKTTLFKTISGLLKPLAGKIEVNGTIGFVTTIRPQVEFLKAKEYLEFGIKQSNDELLSLFEVSELLSKNINELSDGQFKKLAIVRQLLKEPSILLLDEPAAFLDINQKNKLTEYLINIKDKMVVLVSSHDERFIERIADVKIDLNDC